MTTRKLSSIGSITKKDWIILNDRIDEKSTLVFISEHPYSGYYGTTVPDSSEPQSMFLVTAHNYKDDRIIRSIQAVKTYFKYDFDAVPGTISFLNKHLGIIRVRCLSYEHVPELVKAFTAEGIDFMPHRKFPPFEAILRVTKYFSTEEVEEGIFLDVNNPYFAYLHIDRFLRWNTFENIYRQVKNNITDFSFDAALANMYDSSGVLDFVRIFDEKRSIEKLKILHQKFTERIAKVSEPRE